MGKYRVAFLTIWSLCVGRCITAASTPSAREGEQQFRRVELPVFEDWAEDPISKFHVIFPVDGDIETLPLVFRVNIEVQSVDSFRTKYGETILCVELNGTWQECGSIAKSSIGLDGLPAGRYSARAFITDERGIIRYRETPPVSITIVTKEEFDVYSAAMMELSGDSSRNGSSLLKWATHRQVLESLSIPTIGGTKTDATSNGTLLVIGVKTAVVKNFEFRQTIRETWASPDALPHNVKVFFVGCGPNLSAIKSIAERERTRVAISLEKQTYGDLLTDELGCEESYDDLPSKVKAFLRFATQTFSQTSFVMMADDNIYLRTNRLVDELRKEGRLKRLYIGHHGRSQRGGIGYRSIPEELYPLRTYPPFAFGQHYLLSMDCVRFIVKNSERLRGLGGVDDISVGLWLLTMQVHVENTVAFSSLREGTCQNKLISLADLTPFGIQSAHANCVEKRDLCDGFDEVTWKKNRTSLDVDSPPQSSLASLFGIQTYVHDLKDIEYLFVTAVVSTSDNAGVKVSYYPSAETFRAYSRRVCLEARTLVHTINLKSWMCRGITLMLRAQIQQQFHRVEATGSIGPAVLELWRYNLFVADEDASPLIVAYTTESSYASVVFECIFRTIFESYNRPILVVPEKALRMRYGNFPDVFIFSIFDADCEPMTNSGCPEMIAYYMQEYLYPVDKDRAAKVMMISGEAIDTKELDDRVPLLSSVSSVSRQQHVYLPVVSISFAERLRNNPTELLSPVSTSLSDSSERKFCAYLYARCDRPYREYMFDLLNAMEPVDALGICAGSSRPPNKSYRTSRYFKWFNDEAVMSYKDYKFVVAFENSAEAGYVTEKLVNPLLAGSVPIYLGNSTTASQMFNPKSYIDCRHFEKLEDCAAFVLNVHKSPELYDQMRREPPIRNIAMFNEVFSWHPSVPSRALADKVARMLHL
ncbi:hypothetical protein PI124_g3589 [Phytophthora idaei]|nr:hypothetical protein PI125_g3135 [Phytophthora idaei]KAG3171921.1 hypothetical protein PI126_g1633 [Phytophthora idaei]KAG3251823.1 hypothetical protein PI124_g3589 [Phytophthora idaei]